MSLNTTPTETRTGPDEQSPNVSQPPTKSSNKNGVVGGSMERYKKSHKCLSTRLRIYKNVLVLSFAFFLLFSAFMGLVNLQTSIHEGSPSTTTAGGSRNPKNISNLNSTIHGSQWDAKKFVPDLYLPVVDDNGIINNNNNNQGLGAYSMSVVYAGLIISSLFLTQLLINRFALKWTMVASISVYCGYILANLRPSWLTLIPTSLCMGLAAAPLWTAQSAYVTEMGRLLADAIGQDEAESPGYKDDVNDKVIKKAQLAEEEGWSDDGQSGSEDDSGDSDLQDGTGMIMYKSMNCNNDIIEETDAIPFSDVTDPNVQNVSRKKMNRNKGLSRGRAKKNFTDKTIPHLMGIFFCFFQGGQIFGNLISSMTLQSDISKIFDFPSQVDLQHTFQNSSRSFYNNGSTLLFNNQYLGNKKRCGGQYCPYENFEASIVHSSLIGDINEKDEGKNQGPNPKELFSKINMLCYIYAIMCMMAAVIVALLLDPITIIDPSNVTRKHSSKITQEYLSTNPYLGSRPDTSTKATNLPLLGTKGIGHSTKKSLVTNENFELTSPTISTISAKSKKNYHHLNQQRPSRPISSDKGCVSIPKKLTTPANIFTKSINSRMIKDITYFYELGSTFRHMKNTTQILLIPLTIYVGLEQGFVAADFTRAFVTCYFGMRFVGIVMALFGLVDAFTSIAGGSFNNIMPRYVIFSLAATFHLTCLPMLRYYPHFGTRFPMVLVMVSLWGAGDGILQPQLNGFYGAVFAKWQETSAFANYRLWEAVGFIVSFSIHEKLCIQTKLYLLMVTLIIGMVGYAMVEYGLIKSRFKNIKAQTLHQ